MDEMTEMKSLLITTATALLIGTLALAQGTNDEALRGVGDLSGGAGGFLASDLIGTRLYATADKLPETGTEIEASAMDWSGLGQINDLLVGPKGSIIGVIVGIGGFLGLGEREIAVSMDQIKAYSSKEGGRFFGVQITEEELAAVPAFERDRLQGMPADTQTNTAEDQTATDAPQAPVPGQAPGEMAGPKDQITEDSESGTRQGEANRETRLPLTTEKGEVEADNPREGEARLRGDDAPENKGAATQGRSEISAAALVDSSAYTMSGEEIGRIRQVVVTPEGRIEAVIVELGGILGIGERSVAIPFDRVEMIERVETITPPEGIGEFRLHIGATAAQIANMPPWEEP